MKCLYVTDHSHMYGEGGGGTATRAWKARIEEALGPENVALCCFDDWGRRLPRPVKQGLAAGKSLFSSLPSTSVFVLPAGAAGTLSRCIEAESPDVVVINGSNAWFLVDAVPEGLPIVLLSHNLEHRLAAMLAERMAGLRAPLRALLHRDGAKLLATEAKAIGRAGNILSISETDADYFRRRYGVRNIAVVPPTFDYAPHSREPRTRAGRLNVGFMAKMTWWPNREGAAWLIDRVLPQLDADRIAIHFYGQGSEHFTGRLPHIVTHGYVDTLDVIWRNCDFMICPVLSGSGVSIKFAEAVYNRMPVLATTVARRGLAPFDDDCIVCLDDPGDWVDFLSSSRAYDLAAGVVSKDVSDLFAPQTQRPTIARFLEAVMDSRS